MNDQYLPKEDVDDASIRESLLPAWNTSDDKDSSSSGGGGGIGVPRPKLSCRAVKAALGVSLVLNLALVATVGLIVSLHGQNGDPQLGVWCTLP